jgi:hypothetical protein
MGEERRREEENKDASQIQLTKTRAPPNGDFCGMIGTTKPLGEAFVITSTTRKAKGKR